MQVTVSLIVDIAASTDSNQIEQVVQEAGLHTMREATRKAVRAVEEQSKICPYCGSQAVRSEGTDRRVILTKYGRVVLALRRLRCSACRGRFRPAEPCLKGLEAGNVTAALGEACAEAGASWPYATAAQTLKRLCGAHISPEHVRRLTNRAGSREALRQAEEAKALLEPTAAQVRQQREVELAGQAAQQQRPEMLWVGLDGGWVKSREHKKGMEGKGGVVVSNIEPLGKRGRRRMSRRRYVATFQNSSVLGQLTYVATCALGAQEAQRQVVVGDGAGWIKTEADLHFPEATKILDWPHVWRKMQAAMRAVGPGQSKVQRTWRKKQYEQLQPLLWQGQVESAWVHLQKLRPGPDCEPVEAVEEALIYLENQREWIGNYHQWQEAGYPAGSGFVERGVAVVINPGMKRQGMRWRRVNATAVVALRVRLLNAQWDATPVKKRRLA